MLDFLNSWNWSRRTCSYFFAVCARTGGVPTGFGDEAFGRTSANMSAKTSGVTIYILHTSRLGARAVVRLCLCPRLCLCSCLCSVPRLCPWSCSCLCACVVVFPGSSITVQRKRRRQRQRRTFNQLRLYRAMWQLQASIISKCGTLVLGMWNGRFRIRNNCFGLQSGRFHFRFHDFAWLSNALHDFGNHAKVCMIIMHFKLTLCMIGSCTDCVYRKTSNAMYFYFRCARSVITVFGGNHKNKLFWPKYYITCELENGLGFALRFPWDFIH